MALVVNLAGGSGSCLLAFFVGLEGMALPLEALTGLLRIRPLAAGTCIYSMSCHEQ